MIVDLCTVSYVQGVLTKSKKINGLDLVEFCLFFNANYLKLIRFD